MALIRKIPWHTGGGNIIITYSGHGNETVTVSTDSDTREYREQTLTIRAAGGPTAQVTIRQVSGRFLCDKRGYVLNAQWHQLTVTPEAHFPFLRDKNGFVINAQWKKLHVKE